MEAYIYSYVNKKNQKTYIGSRSNYIGSCYDDFNIKYFSSSNDKEFRQDMLNGDLEGLIILIMNDENANKKIVNVEHKMIKAYWLKYGKENSYNHYANGNFNTAGLHIGLGRKKSEEHKLKIKISNFKKHNISDNGRNILINNGKNAKHDNFKGKCHSEETKLKISVSTSGEKNGMFGKHHSEKVKLELSERMKDTHRVYDNPEHTKWHMEKQKFI